MRRLLGLVLAVVLIAGSWLPIRQIDAGVRMVAPPVTDTGARTGQPRQAADLAAQTPAAPAAGWQIRLIHDALAASYSPLKPDLSRSAPVSTDRLRLHASPPLLTYPLLI